MSKILLLVLLTYALTGWSADRPLSLDEVLAHANQPHPELGIAQAQVDLARIEQQLAESQDDFRLTLEAGLRAGRNRLTNDSFEADHLARLNARKTLLDSGRTRLAGEAAQLESAARAGQYLDALSQRRLVLMTRFFDVLLTDMQYAAESELSAVAYVAWDNARERANLGELSSVALAEYEARFQEARLKRNDTLRKAREKRALLAAAMNRPNALPTELLDPVIRGNERKVPELNTLLALLESGNPRLLAHKQRLLAAQKRLAAVRADNKPSLEFEAEAAAYSRDTYTRDNLRAGLNLVWPLWQGQRTDSRLALEQAQFQLLQAQYERLHLDLQQALFETREEISHLLESERPAARINSSLHDWSLERARAEYELELKTNLGTSMAETQLARLRSKSVEYQLMLAWEKLTALLGQACCEPLPTAPAPG